MGYTHHFKIKIQDRFPAEFVQGVQKIVDNSPVKLVGWPDEDPNTRPIVTDTEINLNGEPEPREDNSTLFDPAGENFLLRPNSTDWPFVKTFRKPYDVIVQAILLYAERRGDILVGKFLCGGYRHEKEFQRAKRLLKKLELY